MDLKYPNEELESERLVLKRLNVDLRKDMFTAIASDRKRLLEFLPWAHWMKEGTDELKYIESNVKDWMAGITFNFGIFRKSDRKYLGACGGHRISWDDKRIELGYWLVQEGEGQGYMLEAVKTIETEFFRIGFHRIEIRCEPKNERSSAVAKKMNYKFEGHLRDNLLCEGRYFDTLIFSKLSDQQD